MKKKLKIVYKEVEMDEEERQRHLDRAYDILFDAVDGELGLGTDPENPSGA